MTEKINSKSTKAQIMEAYEELLQEKAQLETEVKQLNTSVKKQDKPTANPIKEIVNSESKPIKQEVTMNNNIILTIQNLEKLQGSFGSAVSHLSEQLITEASALESLQKILTEELEELEELYEIDEVKEDSLSTLIETYEENDKTYQEELSQQQESLEKELEELRKSWQKEKETYTIERREREQNHFKAKQRNEEQYHYNLELARKLDQEEYDSQKKALYQELKEQLEIQEKQWKQREETITKREQEYAEAKVKAENLEQELEQKIKQGKEEGKGIGYYQAKIKSDLRSKEIEGEKQNYQLRIKSLEETIKNQETRNHSLSQQLESSLKQVQDLAVKAIEGTSNRSSFEAMKEIALEQAKNQPKGK
jgi:hypothetical protein